MHAKSQQNIVPSCRIAQVLFLEHWDATCGMYFLQFLHRSSHFLRPNVDHLRSEVIPPSITISTIELFPSIISVIEVSLSIVIPALVIIVKVVVSILS